MSLAFLLFVCLFCFFLVIQPGSSSSLKKGKLYCFWLLLTETYVATAAAKKKKNF